MRSKKKKFFCFRLVILSVSNKIVYDKRPLLDREVNWGGADSENLRERYRNFQGKKKKVFSFPFLVSDYKEECQR